MNDKLPPAEILCGECGHMAGKLSHHRCNKHDNGCKIKSKSKKTLFQVGTVKQ